MTTNRIGYIAHSRGTRRAYRGMLQLAKNLGVEVESRWVESFGQFMNDLGIRPEGTILRRRDNHKGFIAGNCAWIVPPVVAEPTTI
ncbi:hypothetical protein P8936_11655 [Edaphobacter paludis]|uniref:Uncharacterized protein n=1 Tax=Edaphobacter paludis TaxID=3035702 RepID=A0AAU7D316_9BACT